MNEVTLYAGDNRETMKRMIAEGVRVHSVVTDPPYGLVSIQKRFGKGDAKAARTEGNDGSFARLSGGFMGKAWDGTGIERDPDFWKLVYDIMLPGGFVFAFSGSRTGHWQACAMEMAGFIMHPMHGWVFGSGFPKAHNASKAIDKHLKVDRKVTGQSSRGSGAQPNKLNNTGKGDTGIGYADGSGKTFDITEAGSPEAQQWDGWAYGTQTQKPAIEPIYLAQKPMSEKTGAANILKHGVGAMNIDGCRVPADEVITTHSRGGSTASPSRPTERSVEESGRTVRQDFIDPNPREGRHPANLILDGSDEVTAMFPHSKSGTISAHHKRTKAGGNGLTHGKMDGVLGKSFEDNEGSAARFFHQFPPDMDPLFYHPKAGKADRAGSKHPTVKPIALMQYLIRHITPPGGTVLDPFAGSGTTGQAALNEGFDCILMEAEDEYVKFLQDRFGLGDDLDDLFDDLDCDDDNHSDQFEDILG